MDNIIKKWVCLTVSLVVVSSAFAQPHFYQADKSVSVAGGYSSIHMNVDNFQVAFLEATYYMNPQMGWEFSARVEYGKDFLSFEPVGLLGLPMWIYSSSHGLGRESNMLSALISVADAKLPIPVDDEGFFEITPYWSLLKFTRLYDAENFRLNGDVGIQFKMFPIAPFDWSSTFYMSGFAQWNWGYKRSDNYFGRYNVRNNRSDFFGYALGASIGVYF